MYDTCHVSDKFFFKLCHTSTHSKLIFHTALPFSPDNFLKNSKNFHSGEILHFYFSSYSSISFMNFTKLCQFMKDIMVRIDFTYQLYIAKSFKEIAIFSRNFHNFTWKSSSTLQAIEEFKFRRNQFEERYEQFPPENDIIEEKKL